MGGAVQILHVDDDPQFADLTKNCLEAEGEQFRVRTAGSIEEGLDVLQAEAIDCVVSDYDMPESTGIDFLTRVRERSPELPFILFTGKGSEAVASEAITAGVTDYLQKESGTSQFTILANRIRNAVEQRRTRQEVEQTRRRLTEVTENIPDCVWMFDREWEDLLFISGYEAVYNRPVSELKARPQDFLTVVKEEDRDLVRQKMAELSAGHSVDLEYRLSHDDEGRWVWVKGSPIFDDGGNVVRVAGFSRNITDRKAQERKLERLSQRYQAYVESTQDIITVLDETGEIVYQSAAVADVLGYEPDDLLATDGFSYLHPEDREEVFSVFTDLIEDPETDSVRAEFRFEDSEGSWVWLESLASDHTDGEIGGYLINSRDVTDRKAYEKQLRKQNEQLDEFAGVVSHDLRNPLNTATARLELARDDCESPHHEPIDRALTRMERIIEDVLWLARNGREIGETEPIEIRSAVESAWELVVGNEKQPTLEFTGPISPESRLVADRDRLRHLLENVLGNAVEHAGPDVDVAIELEASGLAITDDGPGIPPEDRAEIFDAGYSTTQHGTGFGLRIVDQVADAHGWELSVRNSDDGGARFEISDVEMLPPAE